MYGHSELSNENQIICNNNDLHYQIENYLDYIYSNINTSSNSFDDEFKQSSQFDCTYIHTTEIPENYFSSINGLVVQHTNESSLYLITLLSKSLLTITSVTPIFAIIVAGVIAAILKEKLAKGINQRKSFTQLTRRRILAKQKYRCAYCNKILVVVDFDHKNGNRADSREANCQALCPNCHAIKTRQKTVTSGA